MVWKLAGGFALLAAGFAAGQRYQTHQKTESMTVGIQRPLNEQVIVKIEVPDSRFSADIPPKQWDFNPYLTKMEMTSTTLNDSGPDNLGFDRRHFFVDHEVKSETDKKRDLSVPMMSPVPIDINFALPLLTQPTGIESDLDGIDRSFLCNAEQLLSDTL